MTGVSSWTSPCYEIEYEFQDGGGRLSRARGKSGVVPEKGEWGWELVERPYEGPFDIEVAHFRYVVNETKREYYDRERTCSTSWQRSKVDPLPILMGTSFGHLTVEGEGRRAADGLWVGDLVYPAHEAPVGYADVSGRYGIYRR